MYPDDLEKYMARQHIPNAAHTADSDVAHTYIYIYTYATIYILNHEKNYKTKTWHTSSKQLSYDNWYIYI